MIIEAVSVQPLLSVIVKLYVYEPGLFGLADVVGETLEDKLLPDHK